MKQVLLVASLLSVVVSSGCVEQKYTSKANRVAEADDVKTVAVFRTRCTDVRGGCDVGESLDSVRAAIAEELEFKGMRIVQEEELFARARRRTDASAGVDLPILGPLLAAGSLQEGSTFDDLPPEARASLLQSAGVDGVVESRVSLAEGHTRTLSDYRDVTLQIRMGLKADGSTTSVHRCTWSYASGLEDVAGPKHFSATAKPGVDCALKAQ